MKYNTKFVIKGQIDNDDKIGFTYPKPFDAARPTSEDEWLRSLPDPRTNARPFNSDKIYAYWKNEYGNYYSLIIPNNLDTRDGKLMLTIFTGKHIVSSGKLVIEVLSKLSDGLVPNLKYLASWQTNPEILNRIELYLSDLESSYSDDNYTSLYQTKGNIAYRTYSSQEELEEIIQFPNQVEYDIFKRILIVPQQSVPAQLPTGYEEIKSKIKKTYKVSSIIPNGVSIDGGKQVFVEGDKIKLIYSKEGYVKLQNEFIINGIPNACVRYEGTTLHLLSPEDIGIVFKRGVRLQFRSKKENISRVWIKYNGQQREHQSGDIFIFDDDRSEYELVISANGYNDVNITISKDEILASNVKIIDLHPEERKLKISLETDNGRIDGCVSVKMDDPLYKYLEKASRSGIPINRKKIDSYTREREENRDKQLSKQGFLESIWDSKLFLFIIKILVGFLIIYVLYCAYVLAETNDYPWPFEKNKEEIIDGGNPVFNPEVSQEDNNGDINTQDSNSEQKDINYLKEKDIWIKEDLRTEKYQELYDFISEGKIEEILGKNNSEWFPGPDKVNGYWKTCYEILKAIKDKNDIARLSRVQEEMKRLSMHGSIHLKELTSSLQSVDRTVNNSTGETGVRNETNDKSMKPESNSNKGKNIDVPQGEGRPDSRK